MGIKVIVDSSILIGASLNYFYEKSDVHIIDVHHKISIPLFEFFESNRKKEYGITTEKIERDSRAELIKKIEERIKNDPKVNKEDFKVKSASRIEIMRNFDNLKKCLMIYPIDEKEADKKLLDIYKMYKEIQTIISEEDFYPPRRIYGGNRRFVREMKWAVKDLEYGERKRYTKLKKKFFKKPPDQNDYIILSQAHYLKKFVFKKDDVHIASTDCHFSNIRIPPPPETLVPDMIEECLGIKCEWPDDMLEILKEHKR